MPRALEKTPLALWLTLACALGCGTGAVTDAQGGKDAFWQAFGRGDTAALAAAREQLEASVEAHPDDAQLRRLIGMAYLHSAFERTGGMGPPGPAELAEVEAQAQKALELLGKSVELDSTAYSQSFYAAALYSQASRAGDMEGAERARQLMSAVIAELPALGEITRAAAMRNSPLRSPDYPVAVESYFRFFEQCTGAAIDRSQPDLTPVLQRPWKGPEAHCGNSEHVPHALQGTLLSLGDVLVKAQKPDAARAVYQLISRTEGYSTWPHANLIEERLSADLNARALAYQSGDPRAAPRVGAACFACHQR